LGQLFCRECGAKLDLSKLTPQEVARNNRPGIGPLIRRLVRLSITLALLAVLGLLCWPLPPSGDAPSVAGSGVVQSKMTALRGAIMRKAELKETFSEADINAHLNASLARSVGSGGFRLVLRDVRLDLRAGEAQVWTKSTLGPVPVSYSATTRFTRAPDGQFTFTADNVKIGRITLPAPLRPKVVNQLSSLFLTLQEENLLLQRLAVVESVDGALNVSTLAP
jgi:hypothetical protein